MTTSAAPCPLLRGLNKSDYDIDGLDDEIRVDQLCVDLLRRLYQDLTRENRMSPELAGECCHGADYFLREFVISDRQENLFNIEPIRIRQFAGHWYITRTPEPNLTELKKILAGTAELYHYLARQEMIDETLASGIASQCRDLDYYQQRVDDFWAIEGDGYDVWRQSCPL
jgi:hypothetical protein